MLPFQEHSAKDLVDVTASSEDEVAMMDVDGAVVSDGATTQEGAPESDEHSSAIVAEVETGYGDGAIPVPATTHDTPSVPSTAASLNSANSGRPAIVFSLSALRASGCRVVRSVGVLLPCVVFACML